LRLCSRRENSQNCQKQRKGCTSKYKGVSWRKDIQKWNAYITSKGQRICLGVYEDEKVAAKIYDEAAQKYHGEFAYTNFKQDG
jgi:hypothetical protein